MAINYPVAGIALHLESAEPGELETSMASKLKGGHHGKFINLDFLSLNKILYA